MASTYPQIFLSYRRKDARTAVESLYTALLKYYGPGHIFRDTTIPTGSEYPEVLRDKLAQADAVIVVIGQHWLRPATSGELDWVIEEVRLALAGGKKIFPVLVEDAELPAGLPKEIAGLEVRQARVLAPAPAQFRKDVTLLIRELPQKPAHPAISPQNAAQLDLSEVREQHDAAVFQLAFSSDGKTLISGSEDGSVGWWRGDVVRKKTGHEKPICALGFSPDGKSFVSISADLLRTYASASAALEHEQQAAFQDEDVCCAINPKESTLLASEMKHDPMFYTIPNLEIVGSIPNRAAGRNWLEAGWKLPNPFVAGCLAFSRDGRLLAAGGLLGNIALMLVDDGRLVWSHRDRQSVRAIAFSPNGMLIASSGDKPAVHFRPVLDGTEWQIPISESGLTAVAFSPDGGLLACTCSSGALVLIDVERRVVLRTPVSAKAGISAVAFSPGGERLATGTLDGNVQIWRVP